MYRVCMLLPASMSWARLCPGRPVRRPVPPRAWTARVGAVCLWLNTQFSSGTARVWSGVERSTESPNNHHHSLFSHHIQGSSSVTMSSSGLAHSLVRLCLGTSPAYSRPQPPPTAAPRRPTRHRRSEESPAVAARCPQDAAPPKAINPEEQTAPFRSETTERRLKQPPLGFLSDRHLLIHLFALLVVQSKKPPQPICI